MLRVFVIFTAVLCGGIIFAQTPPRIVSEAVMGDKHAWDIPHAVTYTDDGGIVIAATTGLTGS